MGKHSLLPFVPYALDWASRAKCTGTGGHHPSIPGSCDSEDWCPKHDSDVYAALESRHRASAYA